MKYDAFISHASEDKISFVAPLARALTEFGLDIWYDEFSLKVGDSLSRSIDKGLAESNFGVVVLRPSFLAKPWPEYELRGLVAKEIGQDKVILPVWHGVTRDEVLAFSPPLADKLALNTSNANLDSIAVYILEVIKPEIFRDLMRLRLLKIAQEEELKKAKRIDIDPLSIRPGPIRHKTLPKPF